MTRIKSRSIDLRLLVGFTALLFLIAVIGAIGILQIGNLSKTVAMLGEKYLPMQKSILAMRANNGVYAMEVRNYIFWSSSKYLEAASAGAGLDKINKVTANFDKNLKIYRSLVQTDEQKQWADRVFSSHEELRIIGNGIIKTAESIENTGSSAGTKDLQDVLNRKLMGFESTIHKINDFLENVMEKDSMELIKNQLIKADITKAQALSFLSIAIIIALFMGSQTAFFVYRDRERTRNRREKLVQKMIKLEEEEKRNLSLQVHDQMGQDLSGLRIYLDLINKGLTAKDEDTREYIKAAKDILTNLMEKGHNISEYLRPPALDEIGLVGTVDSLISQYRQMTEIEITYEKPPVEIKVSSEDALFLYRAVQEGLTNIVKHAEASRVNIKLEFTKDENILIIEDDGGGFDYKKFLKMHTKEHKLGLMGLEERAELLNGKIIIKTKPGKGTTLIAKLPRAK